MELITVHLLRNTFLLEIPSSQCRTTQFLELIFDHLSREQLLQLESLVIQPPLIESGAPYLRCSPYYFTPREHLTSRQYLQMLTWKGCLEDYLLAHPPPVPLSPPMPFDAASPRVVAVRPVA